MTTAIALPRLKGLGKHLSAWSDYENVLWKPPPEMLVHEWAAEYRYLTSMMSALPGRFDNSITPYLIEPMDCLNDPMVERLTLKFCTQVGKTTVYENQFGFIVEHLPGPTMFLLPDEDLARSVSLNRIQPMIESIPALSECRTENARDMRVEEYRLRRMMVYFAWAGSPASVSSKSCRYGFADETGKFSKLTAKGEGDPIGLLKERTATYADRFVMDCSTPNIPDGWITREHAHGDRRSYMVPCPHCRAYQRLRMSDDIDGERVPRLRWPEGAEADEIERNSLAWYECECCHERIYQQDKRQMLLGGVWCPEGAEVRNGHVIGQSSASNHRSYHINALYSPFPNRTFSHIASQFLRVKSDPIELRTFVQNWLAEEWKERSQESVPVIIQERFRGYAEGTCPSGAIVLVGFVDVQKDYAVMVQRAWGVDQTSWGVMARRIDLATEGDWDRLEEAIFKTEVKVDGRTVLPMRLCLVDARFRTREVLEFCRRKPLLLRPTFGQGRGQLNAQTYSKKALERDRHGNPYPRGTSLWHINVDWYKDILNSLMTTTDRWFLFNDPPGWYLDQIVAEEKVVQRNTKGTPTEVWQQKAPGLPEHAWDCEVGCVVAADMLKVLRMRSAQPTPSATRTESKPPMQQQARTETRRTPRRSNWNRRSGNWRKR